MTLLFIIFGVMVITIIGLEWLFWRIFRNKISGLLFPHETDTSSLHFFSLARIRACAFVHACFLLAVCCVSFIFLW